MGTNLGRLEQDRKEQKDLFTSQIAETQSQIDAVNTNLKADLAQLNLSNESRFAKLNCQTASHQALITALQDDLARVERQTGAEATNLRVKLGELEKLQGEQTVLFKQQFESHQLQITNLRSHVNS